MRRRRRAHPTIRGGAPSSTALHPTSRRCRGWRRCRYVGFRADPLRLQGECESPAPAQTISRVLHVYFAGIPGEEWCDADLIFAQPIDVARTFYYENLVARVRTCFDGYVA